MKNILKGFIIGIGKIIPGVSGSLLAISLGVYEKVLEIIAHIRQITVQKFIFLLTLSTGFIISISLFSNTVKWLLETVYFQIMLLFIGLIIGGSLDICNVIKEENRRIKNIIIFIMALTFCYTISNLGTLSSNDQNNIFIYFGLGLIEAFSSIVPGISGTAIYMSLGCYDMLLDFFSNIFNPFYFKFSIFFSLGILLGVFILAKSITFLLKYFKIETHYAILGFMTASVIIMFKESFGYIFKQPFDGMVLLEVIIGLLFLCIGYKITIKINTLLAKDSDKSI